MLVPFLQFGIEQFLTDYYGLGKQCRQQAHVDWESTDSGFNEINKKYMKNGCSTEWYLEQISEIQMLNN